MKEDKVFFFRFVSKEKQKKKLFFSFRYIELLKFALKLNRQKEKIKWKLFFIHVFFSLSEALKYFMKNKKKNR